MPAGIAEHGISPIVMPLSSSRQSLQILAFLLGVLLVAGPGCRKKETPAAYLDQVLDLMEQNSINRGPINWPAFRRQAHERAKDARTIQELQGPLRDVIKDLGDHHSFLRPAPSPGGQISAFPKGP